MPVRIKPGKPGGEGLTAIKEKEEAYIITVPKGTEVLIVYED